MSARDQKVGGSRSPFFGKESGVDRRTKCVIRLGKKHIIERKAAWKEIKEKAGNSLWWLFFLL